jgi:hypothetical protein
MAQPAPAPFVLTKHQTADLMGALEERKYGRRLNAEELAQKASVSLDDVNRVERHLPLGDQPTVEQIAHALGISGDLLGKVAGLVSFTPREWQVLQGCLTCCPPDQPVPDQCQSVGIRRIWK